MNPEPHSKVQVDETKETADVALPVRQFCPQLKRNALWGVHSFPS